MKERIIEAIKTHRKMLDELEKTAIETITAAAELIIDSLKSGGTLYICGNGGSAADAQHIAGEFIGRFLRERKAMPAVALSTDTSVLTCVGNDYSFDDVFTRQVEALVGENDCLWALSTSGISANIVAAAKLAKDKGAKIIAFTGRSESKLEKIADVCVCAEAEISPRSQEIHQLAYHIICDLVEEKLQ